MIALTKAPGLRGVALCTALVLAPTSLWAQQPATNPAAARTAREHYEAGTRLYGQGRFADAANEFQIAYTVSQRAELLFNLGRAYEDAGMYVEALDAYERFDRAGAPGFERAQLRGRIDIVRARLNAQRATTQTSSTATTTNTTTTNNTASGNGNVAVRRPDVVVAPDPVPVRRRRSAVPFVLMGVGGALVLGAIPLWLGASSNRSELEAYCMGEVCTAGTVNGVARSEAELTALRDDGFTYALAGDVLAGVGVTSLVVGAILFATGSRSESPPAMRPRASAVRGGGVVGMELSF